ncbi:MAG: T9SS type A sorting domain-containing protein, partial [Archaeoglobus sp.]|nr:T9SS type A sorting domain-containing protein [Archaeoglobus sp.]
IFNILGQKIYTFEFKNQSPGYHRVIWNGRNQSNCPVSSGLYIYRIKAGNFIASKKMLLIR